MYIIDLFVNIFKGKKFASLIWIIVNAVIIVYCIASFLDIIAQGSLEDWIVFVLSFAIYLISIVIALSPVGEALMRWQNGCKKITDSEILARIEPLFNEVFENASRNNPELNQKIDIYICDEEEPNAFAAGRKTICITKGLLELSDDEIKGIIAHEFGHIEHKDTDVILIVTVGNMLVTTILTVIGFIVRVFNMIVAFFASIAMSERGAFVTGFLTSKFNAFVSLLFGAIAWLWTKLGVIICIRSARNQEYEADAYAYEIGFGKQLIRSLSRFAATEPKNKKSIWAMLSATHPENSLRIEKLNALFSSTTSSYASPVKEDNPNFDYKAPVYVAPVKAEDCSHEFKSPVYTAPVNLEYEDQSYAYVPPIMISEPRTYTDINSGNEQNELSMAFHKVFMLLFLPASILGAISNLYIQATNIMEYGISFANILITLIAFSSIIVSSSTIYMLLKQFRGAENFAITSALISSVSALVVTCVSASTISDPFISTPLIIIECVLCIIYSTVIWMYYSKRTACFNK